MIVKIFALVFALTLFMFLVITFMANTFTADWVRDFIDFALLLEVIIGCFVVIRAR
jgi:hypothetical protein